MIRSRETAILLWILRFPLKSIIYFQLFKHNKGVLNLKYSQMDKLRKKLPEKRTLRTIILKKIPTMINLLTIKIRIMLKIRIQRNEK